MIASQMVSPQEVHEFLTTTEAYRECPSQVETKETHISWLYLTDRFVYKQKKPVKFDFLDFSTLASRKRDCEDELEFNRRFSPEIYLRVVPVWLRKDGQLSLKDGEVIVEWLVKMTKLEESRSLECTLREGHLTDAEQEALAARLAHIYSTQAPAMVRSDEFISDLRNHIEANGRDLSAGLPKFADQITFLTRLQLQTLSLHAEDFRQRVADGRVIDGHGDLRPEHIYFHRAQPVLIDCVEFSREYRTNDVADELAFLAMECDRLGHPHLGQRVLSQYLSETADECPPALIAFFKCYRACVRAKIAMLQRRGNGATERWGGSPEDYLDLASSYADQIHPKTIVVVAGLSGTGKSTLATAIREHLPAESLHTDLIRHELFHSSEAPRYSIESRRRVYRELLERTSSALGRSPTVVLDGTFSEQMLRHAVADVAAIEGAQVIQIQSDCPIEIAKQRIEARRSRLSNISDATPETVEEQAAIYEPPLADFPVLTVDTTTPLLDQLELVRGALKQLRN